MKKTFPWKTLLYIAHFCFLLGLVVWGFFVCINSVYYSKGIFFHNGVITFYYLFFCFLAMIINGIVLPAMTLNLSCLTILKHAGDAKAICKRICQIALISLGAALLIWGVFEYFAHDKEIFLHTPLDSVWNVSITASGVSAIQWWMPYRMMMWTQTLPVLLVHLLPAAVGWLVLRRKNKQVAVNVPTTETAPTPTE